MFKLRWGLRTNSKNKIQEPEGWVVDGGSVKTDFKAHSGSQFQLSVQVRAEGGTIINI